MLLCAHNHLTNRHKYLNLIIALQSPGDKVKNSVILNYKPAGYVLSKSISPRSSCPLVVTTATAAAYTAAAASDVNALIFLFPRETNWKQFLPPLFRSYRCIYLNGSHPSCKGVVTTLDSPPFSAHMHGLRAWRNHEVNALVPSTIDSVYCQ